MAICPYEWYDLLGREVATLVNEVQDAGTSASLVEPFTSATFDASGLASGVSSKGGYASGVYLYRLTARQTDGGQAGSASAGSAQVFVETKKLLLLR